MLTVVCALVQTECHIRDIDQISSEYHQIKLIHCPEAETTTKSHAMMRALVGDRRSSTESWTSGAATSLQGLHLQVCCQKEDGCKEEWCLPVLAACWIQLVGQGAGDTATVIEGVADGIRSLRRAAGWHRPLLILARSGGGRAKDDTHVAGGLVLVGVDTASSHISVGVVSIAIQGRKGCGQIPDTSRSCTASSRSFLCPPIGT